MYIHSRKKILNERQLLPATLTIERDLDRVKVNQQNLISRSTVI